MPTATVVPLSEYLETSYRPDRIAEMQDRIDDYLNFGVRCVWLIHPKTRRAFVYTPEGVREVKHRILSTEGPEIRVPLTELD